MSASPASSTSSFETPDREDEFATRYPEQVRALLATLRLSHLGGIFVAECDDIELRKRLFAYFRDRLADENIYLYPFEVSDTDLNLVRTLRNLTDQAGFKNLELVGRYRHIVLFVYGLEKYDARQRDQFLHLLNFLRDAFTLIEQPVVIWAYGDMVTQMARQAPDFWSWKGTVFTFAPPSADAAGPARPAPWPRGKPSVPARYLREILSDPEFFIWRDLYLPLRVRRIAETIKQAFVREQLVPEQIAALREHCDTRDLQPGEILIQAQQEGDTAYVVTQGRLAVSITDRHGDELFGGQVGPGDIVGEIALLEGVPRTATVRALSAAQVLVIDRNQFAMIETADPYLAAVIHSLGRQRLEKLEMLLSPLRRLATETQELLQQPAEDAITTLVDDPHAVLLGEAGAGKTTVLRRLMLDLAEQARTDLEDPARPVLLPIYVKLNLLTEQRAIPDLILDTLQHCGIYEIDNPGAALTALADRGQAGAAPVRFAFLLDGLNEMPPNVQTRRALRAFRYRFFDHQFVITCRTQYHVPIPGYRAVVLQPLSNDDIAAFLDRYLPADKARAVLHEMRVDPQLMDLGQNPLALYMFSQIARDSQQALPRNRGVLYQRFTHNLLERTDTEWYRIFGRSKSRVPLAVRQHALAELALHMQREGIQTIARARCLEIWRAMDHQLTPAPGGPAPTRSTAPDIFAECIHSSLLRLSPDRSQVEFIHQAVQEYFAAQGLLLDSTRITTDDPLLNHDQRRRWESVIVLYFGVTPDKSSTLRALLQDSANYDNIWLAAECLASIDMAPETIDSLRRLLSEPEEGTFLYAQGLAYRRLGRYPEALARLHEAAKSMPRSAYVHYDMGCLYRQMNQYQRAIQSLETVLQIDPFFVDAYNQLGITYYEQAQFVEALTVFQTTIQLEPDNAYHYYNLGRVHKMLRLYEDALAAFRYALDLKPDYEEARAQLDILQKALDTGALDILEKIPLLSKLTLEQFVMISSRLQAQEYEPGDIIFSQGEIGDSFFIIESGQVEVLSPRPDGEVRVINVLAAGDFFGEIALLRAMPRTATVVVRSRTRLLALNRADFDAIIHYPAIADRLEETSSRRLLQDRHRRREVPPNPLDMGYVQELIQQIEVSALVSDIHGSTLLTQAIGPELMMDFLDEFLLEATNTIIEYNGTLGKSLGDSVLGVFGSAMAQDEPAPSHGIRAVLAAIEMRRAFVHLRERWQRLYPEHQRAFAVCGLGTGVCTGKVALGTVGTEQTMVGDPVNTAAHLSKVVQHNRDECDVYLDPRTYALTSNAFKVQVIHLPNSPDLAASIYRVIEQP